MRLSRCGAASDTAPHGGVIGVRDLDADDTPTVLAFDRLGEGVRDPLVRNPETFVREGRNLLIEVGTAATRRRLALMPWTWQWLPRDLSPRTSIRPPHPVRLQECVLVFTGPLSINTK